MLAKPAFPMHGQATSLVPHMTVSISSEFPQTMMSLQAP